MNVNYRVELNIIILIKLERGKNVAMTQTNITVKLVFENTIVTKKHPKSKSLAG